MTKNLIQTRIRRVVRNRKKLVGTENKPRLAVYRSNLHLNAQIIDDSKSKTLIGASDKTLVKEAGNKVANAKKFGLKFGKLMLEKKITTCVFDRRWYQYHGRVKAFAEGVREAGIKI